MNSYVSSYDLYIFDVDGTMVSPKAKESILKAREARGEKEDYRKVVSAYVPHLNLDVFSTLDSIPLTADVVVLTDRRARLEAETLALLEREFFPRMGVYTKRAFLSFRTDKEASTKEKVRRILAFSNALRSLKGKVSRVQNVLMFEDDADVVRGLKRARRKKTLLPDKFTIRQPCYDAKGRRLPMETHNL